MAPIDQTSIRVERWTKTKDGVWNNPGDQITQVLAEGDNKTPGSFVFERGVHSRARNLIRAENLIVDVKVDRDTGAVVKGLGIWRRYKERA